MATRIGLGIGIGLRRRAANSAPTVGPNIYVSALGTGSGAAPVAPTTWSKGLAAARAWIAAGRSAPTVHVLDIDGPIWLRNESSAALKLDASLSGVTIQAYPGHRPILSGGADISGTWTGVGGGVYEAVFAGPVAYTPRELYVGGLPAELARTDRLPAGWAVNLGGGGLWNGTLTAPDSSYAAAAHPTDMRIAMVAGGARWRFGIVRVVGISGTTITCHPDDVAAATAPWPTYGTIFSLDTVLQVEGLQELVPLREGSFAAHLNGDGSVTVRYRPRPGEDMATVSAILPVLDLESSPLRIGGTQAAPAVNVVIDGVILSHFGSSGVDLRGAVNHGGDRMIRGAAGLCDLTKESFYYVVSGALVFRWANECTVRNCIVEHNGATGIVFDVGTRNPTLIGTICAENAGPAVRQGDDIRTVQSSHTSDGSEIVNATIANCVFTDNCLQLRGAGQVIGYFFSGSTWRNSVSANSPYANWLIGRGTGLDDPTPPYAGMVGFGLGFPDPSLVPGGAPWTTPSTSTGGNTLAKLVSDGAILETWNADGGGFYINGAARVDARDTITGCVATSQRVGSVLYTDNASRYIDVVDFAGDGSVNVQILSPPAIDCTFTNTHLANSGSINTPRQPSVTDTGTVTYTGAWGAAGRAIADAAGLESAYASLRYPQLTSEHATAWATSYNAALSVYGPQLAISGRIVGATPTGWLSAPGDSAPAITVDCGILHDVQRVELHLAAGTANFIVEAATQWDFSDAVVLWTQGATTVPPSRPVIIRALDRRDLLGTFRFVRLRSTSGGQLSVPAFRVFARPTDSTLLSGSLDFTARPLGPWATSFGAQVLPAHGVDLCYRNSPASSVAGPNAITAPAAAGIALQGAGDDGTHWLLVEGAYPSATTYLVPSAWGTAGSGTTYTPVVGPDGTTSTGERVQVGAGGYSAYGSFNTGVAIGQKFTVAQWVREAPSSPGGPWHGEAIDGATYYHAQGAAPAVWSRVVTTWTAASTTIGEHPFDARALGQPNTPVVWPHAIDVLGGPVTGVARAEPLLTVPSSALVATIFTDSAGYRRIVGGRCKPTFDIDASFSSANIGAAGRCLLVDQDNAAGTFVRVNADRTVTVSVAGTAIALPTPIPAWSIGAGGLAKRIQISLDFGAGAPSGSVIIDGVTTSLGTGAGSHAALTVERWWRLSNNGANAFEGGLRRLLWRA